MKKCILFIALFSLFLSCSDKNKLDVDVSSITAEANIKRFEQVFYTAKPKDLPKIKQEYRFLFPHDIDSVWVNKMSDKDEQELFAATQKKYPNMNVVKPQLIELFKHVKYYYPKFREPNIITLNSNVALDQKVVYADSLLFISLDVFLGKDSEIYQTYPSYLKQNFTTTQIFVSVAEELARPIIFRSKSRTFLSRIIQEGKKMYVIDAFLPNLEDKDKIGYSLTKMNWIEANESMIWSYFVEKELLYSTDISLNKRFISDSPFSKFYLDIDNSSPGKVGSWLGWQIVRSYMKHNKEVSLADLLNSKNETIFQQSKYKPKR